MASDKNDARSSQENGKLFKSGTTRREFLKLSGAGIAGAAVSATLLKLFGGSPDAVVYETASGAIIAEPARCTGCRRCETVCTTRNDGKAHPYVSRVKVNRNLMYGHAGVTAAWWKGEGQMGNYLISADTCRQCEEPYCASQCPNGAIEVNKQTGARVVNEEKCVGRGTCQQACPWGMITVDAEAGKAKKCLLCNGYPGCADNCPTGALRFVTWEEAVKTYKKHWGNQPVNA